MGITLQQLQHFARLRRDWLGEGGKPSPHAQERTAICLKCPRHVTDHPLEEAAKKAVVHATLNLKRFHDWHVEGDTELHLCGVCWCYLPLKVFVPLGLARENTPDWQTFPEECWMRRDDLT